MANTDWAFGFQPYQKLLRANIYAVTTAPAINIHPGDVVGTNGSFASTPKYGYLMEIYDDAVIDGKNNLLGSVLAVFDENMDPLKYMTLGRVGNSTIAGYVLVADHPDQLFVAREDFDGNAIDITEGGNANIVSVALSVGNTSSGLSRQMIDSDSAATTAALNVKLLYPHPNDGDLVADDTPGSSGDEGARWVCTLTEHYFGQPSTTGGQSA